MSARNKPDTLTDQPFVRAAGYAVAGAVATGSVVFVVAAGSVIFALSAGAALGAYLPSVAITMLAMVTFVAGTFVATPAGDSIKHITQGPGSKLFKGAAAAVGVVPAVLLGALGFETFFPPLFDHFNNVNNGAAAKGAAALENGCPRVLDTVIVGETYRLESQVGCPTSFPPKQGR